MPMTEGTISLVPTPVGDARVTVHPAVDGSPVGLLALGHGGGRGSGIQAAELQALATALPPLGIEVALVEQPWVVAGGRWGTVADLEAAWLAAVLPLARRGEVPLLVGGRSMGALVACRTAPASGALGVLALAFPLHRRGVPDQERCDADLLGTGLPTLVVQGGEDPLGDLAAFPELPPTHRLLGLPVGDHNFTAPEPSAAATADLLARITGAVTEWASAVLSGPSSAPA